MARAAWGVLFYSTRIYDLWQRITYNLHKSVTSELKLNLGYNGRPVLSKDLFGDHLVRQLDVRGHVALGVVGGGAAREWAGEVPLPRVSLHVVLQSKQDVELPPACGALVFLVVPAALLLAVFPPLQALEIFPAIRTEISHNFEYLDR